MTNTLHNQIMRRIYYAFAIRVITMRGVLQGFLMLTVIIALTRFVSLGNVIHNMMGVQVGQLGMFFYNAVRTTEAWTLLLIGLFVFALLSLRFENKPQTRFSNEHSFAK